MASRTPFLIPILALGLLWLASCSQNEPETEAAAATDTTKIVNCCIKPSCEVCVERFGKCTCLEDLKAGRAICGECIHGYQEGKGKLKLIAIPELKRKPGT